MTDSAGFEFLKVNDNNLVKISIKIYVRSNERILSIIFFLHQYLSNIIKCVRHSPLTLIYI